MKRSHYLQLTNTQTKNIKNSNKKIAGYLKYKTLKLMIDIYILTIDEQ